MADITYHVKLMRLAQISTSYNSKYLSNHHCVITEIFNKSAAAEETSSKASAAYYQQSKKRTANESQHDTVMAGDSVLPHW